MRRCTQKIREKISDYTETKLHRICQRMNQKSRVIAAVTIILISGFFTVYLVIEAVYEAGKHRGRQEIEIKHIAAPEFVIKPEQNHKNQKHGQTNKRK